MGRKEDWAGGREAEREGGREEGREDSEKDRRGNKHMFLALQR